MGGFSAKLDNEAGGRTGNNTQKFCNQWPSRARVLDVMLIHVGCLITHFLVEIFNNRPISFRDLHLNGLAAEPAGYFHCSSASGSPLVAALISCVSGDAFIVSSAST